MNDHNFISLLRVFASGMIISFLGSLPLGTLNVAALNISMTSGYMAALCFAAGCLVPEIMYVRLSLVTIAWINRQKKFLRVIDWITLAVLCLLASWSLIISSGGHETTEKIMLLNPVAAFISGFLMGAVNPAQIPFWLGWNAILFNRKILRPFSKCYNIYTLGIAVGSISAFCAFIFGGKFIAGKMGADQSLIHLAVSIFFILAAVFQFWKLISRKNALESVNEQDA